MRMMAVRSPLHSGAQSARWGVRHPMQRSLMLNRTAVSRQMVILTIGAFGVHVEQLIYLPVMFGMRHSVCTRRLPRVVEVVVVGL